MSDVPVWHCELKDAENLTVGKIFGLNCTGDISVKWNGKPEISLPEKVNEHALALLKATKLDPNAVELEVTSYAAGEFKPDFVRVMTGDAGFEISGLAWKTQSVLKNAGQGQPPQQPYPPYGPFLLPVPLWFWFLVGVVAVILSSAAIATLRMLTRRRRLKRDLSLFATPTAPIAQLHKEVRQLARTVLAAKDLSTVAQWNVDLNKTLRAFLLRELQMLAMTESRARLFKNWRTKNRAVFDERSEGLKKIFSEMDRIEINAAKHKTTDFEQILGLVRVWADKMEASLRKVRLQARRP